MGRREIIADLLKQHPDTAINRIAVKESPRERC
jgi:hypothetical protein